MPAPIRALIFDFDGLIVDTESAIYQSWREMFLAHGHDWAVERFAASVGSDFNEECDPVAELERLTGKKFDWTAEDGRRDARIRELLAGAVALPGVRERLTEAAELGLPCSVASSSSHRWVNGWLERLELRQHFMNLSTRDCVERIKPSPDLFLHALDKLGVSKDEALIFEDSLNGLRAAQAAGIRCLVIPGPTTRHLDFPGAWRMAESMAAVSIADLAGAS